MNQNTVCLTTYAKHLHCLNVVIVVKFIQSMQKLKLLQSLLLLEKPTDNVCGLRDLCLYVFYFYSSEERG